LGETGGQRDEHQKTFVRAGRRTKGAENAGKTKKFPLKRGEENSTRQKKGGKARGLEDGFQKGGGNVSGTLTVSQKGVRSGCKTCSTQRVNRISPSAEAGTAEKVVSITKNERISQLKAHGLSWPYLRPSVE